LAPSPPTPFPAESREPFPSGRGFLLRKSAWFDLHGRADQTTEALVTDLPEETPPMPGGDPGMGGMM